MASTLFPLIDDWCVCAGCCCSFSTIRFRRKFLPYSFFCEWVIFSASGMAFSLLFLCFCSLRFLTGAPLDTYHIYSWFYTFRQKKIYYRRLFLRLWPFWEKVISEPEACIEETVCSIFFILFNLFSVYIEFFVSCFHHGVMHSNHLFWR